MSSEWWSLFAVFWVLYLADGIRGGRRDRLFFYAWRGGRSPRAGVVQAKWHCALPLPSAWTLLADDLPAALAPEGLTNWPAVSAGRPPPIPESVVNVRWEDVERVEQRRGWIHVNGRRFTPVTPALSAAALGRLARELAPLTPDARAAVLRNWQVNRFAPARLKRRLKSALMRTRGIVELNTLQFVLMAALTGYVLLDGPAKVPEHVSERLAASLPGFLGLLAALHIVAVVWFHRLHRRYFPAAGQERTSMVFTALFVPPQALRLRQQLLWKLGEGVHPLTVALAAGHPSTAREIAIDTLRDARFPRRPETLPAVTEQLVASAAAVIEPIVLAQLSAFPALPETAALLAPPRRETATACAYCPRCGDQFVRPDARCAHGVKLVRF